MRLELQADCYAGLWAHRADKYAGILEPGDIEEGARRRERRRRRHAAAQRRTRGRAGFLHAWQLRAAQALVHGTGFKTGSRRSLRHLQGGRSLIVHKHPVPEAFAANAVVKAADYRSQYEESIRDPEGFWARIAKRIDWMRAPTRIRNVSFDPDDFRIRWYEDGELNVSVNCLDRQLEKRANKTALLFEGDDPSVSRRVTYRELYERGMPLRQCAPQARRKEGRPRHDLHADDPGGRGRDARLRPHRRDPLGRVRRVLARIAGGPHRGLRLHDRDHGRRRRAWRKEDPAEGECRRGDRCARARRQERRRRSPDRRPGRLGRWARPALRGNHRGRARGLRARADERGRPALHPLHLRLDRKTEGRAAHERRLSGVRELHLRLRVRLPRRGHLLVHGRRRLGDRAQLHRLRPAFERRDEPDVRGRAELSRHFALLARGRQAQGHDFLHRAHGDPRAHAGGRRAGQGRFAGDPAAPRLRRRTDQSRGLGVVPPRRG